MTVLESLSLLDRWNIWYDLVSAGAFSWVIARELANEPCPLSAAVEWDLIPAGGPWDAVLRLLTTHLREEF